MKKPFEWNKELWNYLFFLTGIDEKNMSPSQKTHWKFYQGILEGAK